jgi:hypothetical protein
VRLHEVAPDLRRIAVVGQILENLLLPRMVQ